MKDLDWTLAQGIRPRLGFCVGSGYSREEMKALLFEKKISFVGHAVTDPVGLASRIARVGKALGAESRQEVLRYLLSIRSISTRFPELNRLKKKSGFFVRLDRALQSGRMTYAHEEERQVMEERLSTLWKGVDPLRSEVHALAQAYEAWMISKELYDDVLVYRAAIRMLQEGAWPEDEVQEVVVFHTQPMGGLERFFWDTLTERGPRLRWISPIHSSSPTAEGDRLQPIRWENWHTLDDAVESLLDSMDPERDVILIPDEPSIRRTLQRALSERRWVLEDPRDPMALRTDERFKRALLPLRVLASDFSRADVLAWVGHGEIAREIVDRGIYQGLESYRGGSLNLLYLELQSWQNQIGKKGSLAEISTGHLSILKEMEGVPFDFFRTLWETYQEDICRTDRGDLRAPARFWIQGFLDRYQNATPPVERLKPDRGLRIYRLTQQTVQPFRKLWVFGMPSGFLSQNQMHGDYWLSARDREILGVEFEVLSGRQQQEARIKNLQEWRKKSEEMIFLSAEYGEDGRELESIAADLRSLGVLDPVSDERGGHSRWMPSFSAIRPVPAQHVQLTPSEKKEIRATDLDRYSRCAFQGLAYSRWKLQDGRNAEMDLWPDVRGRILHTAVKLILENQLDLSVSQAVEQAWELEKIRGWIASPLLEKFQKKKMETILLAFVEAEKKYRERSGCTVFQLEGPLLEWIEEGIRIYGVPDRVDRHPDGLWIIDFKTEADLPHGDEMVDGGYRLQLPAYALAAQTQLGIPVLGVQFIRLREGAERYPGIFPKKYNGKTPGSIVETRARRSILDDEPVRIWEKVQEQVIRHAQAFLNGEFSPRPKREQECVHCKVKDLCGRRRVLEKSEELES